MHMCIVMHVYAHVYNRVDACGFILEGAYGYTSTSGFILPQFLSSLPSELNTASTDM